MCNDAISKGIFNTGEHFLMFWKLICMDTLQMGRSASFNLGGSYGQRQQQHQGSTIMPTSAAPGSFSGANSSDLLQMHSAADVFQVKTFQLLVPQSFFSVRKLYHHNSEHFP
jgi:hypothetical protein